MYGEVLKQAPEGFVPYHQWPEYALAADVPPFLRPRIVGKDPIGMYRSFWPIVVEEYISDKEPVLADSDPEGISANRMIIWQRLFNAGEMPAGWRRLEQKPSQMEGFALVKDDTYHMRWSESARRYLRQWEKEYSGKGFEIQPIHAEEFQTAYTKSGIKPFIRKLYAGIVDRKVAAGGAVRFIGVRHTADKEILAAMALVDSPTHHGSHYLCGFIQPAFAHVPAMVALVDHWHKDALARGIRFLHFGRFWQKGDPDDWKGFSAFKSKFGLYYISYPPALWRFQRGRLF